MERGGRDEGVEVEAAVEADGGSVERKRPQVGRYSRARME